MEVGSKTIIGELQNWLEDYAPADQIEKCAKSLEAMALAHSLQERQSELEMFKKLPIQVISKEIAAHISRRYKQLESEKGKL